MRAFHLLGIVASWAVAVASARAVDLSKIDRSIRRHPVYQSKDPQYCLLVFGPEAKVRVWLVLDGDAMYVDRNGNGDLTDPGERMLPQRVLHRSPERRDTEVYREFVRRYRRPAEDPSETSETILSCVPEVTWFYVLQIVPRADSDDEFYRRRYSEKPFRVAMAAEAEPGGWEADASLAFASQPQDAPILHFNGPRYLAIDDLDGPLTLGGARTTWLRVSLTTPGLNATVRTYGGFADGAYPVADVECPSRRRGEEPIRFRVELTEPC